jgi:hypothetical protein
MLGAELGKLAVTAAISTLFEQRFFRHDGIASATVMN